MKIQGKTALITGASRGIGRAIALEFARQGVHRLILVSRSEARLSEVATTVNAINPAVDAVVLPMDLTRPVEVNIAIAQAWRDYGAIQILVNCAGVAHQQPFLRSHHHHINNEIATNLVGTYTITRLLGRRMASVQNGTIVNVSSLMGKIGAPTMATYSATKFALVGFTQALRSELAPAKVRVVSLLPTLTDTDMARDIDQFRWMKPMTPERVAVALMQGLRRDSGEILVGWQSHLAVWGSKIAPWLVDYLIRCASPLSHTPVPQRHLSSAHYSAGYGQRPTSLWPKHPVKRMILKNTASLRSMSFFRTASLRWAFSGCSSRRR